MSAIGKLWNKSAKWSLNKHICMPGHRKRACFSSWIACKPHLSQVPSWCSQLLVSTCSAWECNLKRATLHCVCLPKSRCRYLDTQKGGPSTVTDLRGKATQLWCIAALSIWSSLPSWFAWFQILLKLYHPNEKEGHKWGSGGFWKGPYVHSLMFFYLYLWSLLHIE